MISIFYEAFNCTWELGLLLALYAIFGVSGLTWTSLCVSCLTESAMGCPFSCFFAGQVLSLLMTGPVVKWKIYWYQNDYHPPPIIANYVISSFWHGNKIAFIANIVISYFVLQNENRLINMAFMVICYTWLQWIRGDNRSSTSNFSRFTSQCAKYIFNKKVETR